MCMCIIVCGVDVIIFNAIERYVSCVMVVMVGVIIFNAIERYVSCVMLGNVE